MRWFYSAVFLVGAVSLWITWPEEAISEPPGGPHIATVSKDTPPAETVTEAALTKHAAQLKNKHGADGFTVVVQPPFVVVGNESPKRVQQRAAGTVGWAVRLLKKKYFEKPPGELITIWLFKDASSYYAYSVKLFGSKPGTPYGYFSPDDKAMVMNIATGGGTLVHEIVHPFVRSNFPDCPSWFNEGLASLYEQCAEDERGIVGRTNWRLDGLQKAIRAGEVPPFETLMKTTTSQFYDDDPGTNYGQARYLCYYLQEQGLLVSYYQAFRKNVKSDPTGIETLKKVLKTEDLSTFQKKWEKWVLTLTFP